MYTASALSIWLFDEWVSYFDGNFFKKVWCLNNGTFEVIFNNSLTPTDRDHMAAT